MSVFERGCLSRPLEGLTDLCQRAAGWEAERNAARLMRREGLVGCHRRRPCHTTQRDRAAEPSPDLVQRTFAATAPNALWLADITCVPTWEGFLYLPVLLDVFSRCVVGWSMAEPLRTELVVAALEMAIWNRRPAQRLIHLSDHGCQYTSLAFGERCRAVGIRCPGGLGRRLLR